MSNLFDIILSPYPANPFCWSVLLIDGDSENYRIHKGVYNFSSKISACPKFFAKIPPEMSQKPPVFKNTANNTWFGLYETSYGELFDETSKNCRLRAWLQFTRAPLKDGRTFKDARFLRGDKGFANLETKNSENDICPPYPVPWKAPFKYEKFLKQAP